ncbi:putative lipid-transfer protein, mitochondrial precursor [Xylariales sp. PMI_506]|nr:putative lipid-transfer protein, mitochondrial precursor [Xylariales sp. PMI_506]
MSKKTFVAGVGMTPFNSPKKSASLASDPDSDYFDLAVEAGVKALLDAGLTYDDVDQGVGCYVFGDSTCGQRVFYSLGMTGIPIFNVNNYCSSGSTGLWLANQAIKSGAAGCVLVIGFDKMYPGALPQIFKDRTNPLSRILDLSKTQIPEADRNKPSPGWTPQLYANAQTEYLAKYGPAGAQRKDFAQITSVNRTHGVNNPYSQLSKAVSAEEVLASPTVSGDITRLQCCPSSTGAAAVVLVSEAFLASHPYLKSTAVEVAGQALATDASTLFESASAIELIGSDMTRQAAKQVYSQAGITAQDVSIVELHDCFTTNEMCALEGLGLAQEGQAWKLVRDGGITYGKDGRPGLDGKGWIVNPSGGLIAKGHPLGATGLAQCAELVWHLRGWAKSRSVPSTKYCLQHNMGLGGATVVTLYKRADGKAAPGFVETRPEADGRSRLGYNPAEEARSISREDWLSVISEGKGLSKWATAKLPWNRDPGAYNERAKL